MLRPRSFAFLLFGFAVLAALASRAGAQAVKGLAYQFKAGDTIYYAVTIVADRPDATESYQGYIALEVKSVGPAGATIHPVASLPGKLTRKAAAPAPGKGFKSKGGPGSGSTSIIVGTGKGSPFNRPVLGTTVAPFGDIVSSTGDIGLYYLLGSVTRLTVEPLSRTGENRWQRTNETTLRELDNSSPFAKMDGPRTTSTSAARETVNYEIVGAMDSLVRIKKTSEFKTLEGGNAPKIQMLGSADLVFDTKLGAMSSCDYKATLTFNEQNVSVSIPITVSYRVMNAEEAAAAKKAKDDRIADLKDKAKERANANAALAQMSDEDITKAVEEIKTGGTKGILAASRLAKAEPIDERREEVSTVLEAAAKGTNDQLRGNAVKAMANWGTKKNVPTLVAMLKDSNPTVKGSALEALGGIKDGKSADEVAKLLADLGSRSKASAALKAMGPVAEKAVLLYSKHQQLAVRKEVCKILADIGTPQSFPALKLLLADRAVAGDAAAAMQAIQARQ